MNVLRLNNEASTLNIAIVNTVTSQSFEVEPDFQSVNSFFLTENKSWLLYRCVTWEKL